MAHRQLYFELGRLHDKLGSFDEAFESFSKGNLLAGFNFDSEKHTKKIDCRIAAFLPEVMGKLTRAFNRSERPVFIVGMPRSGTTLVEQIVAGHSEVFGAGELRFLPDLVHSLPSTVYPVDIETITREVLDGLAKQYLDRLDELDQIATRVTDKMPRNFLDLGLIALLFPGARIIHCIRDPLDTCLSIFFQDFTSTHDYSSDLASIGYYYKEYQRLMLHWQTVIDIPIFEVRYEELVDQQEQISREMIEFCGLSWDAHCLEFHQQKRTVATASYDQVRRPIYRSSLARWKNYETYLEPLKEALGMR